MCVIYISKKYYCKSNKFFSGMHQEVNVKRVSIWSNICILVIYTSAITQLKTGPSTKYPIFSNISNFEIILPFVYESLDSVAF